MQQIDLANTIRQFRSDRAWTQEHLALAAGLAARTVQRVEESGQCSRETLLALAGAFDIDVAVLTLYTAISSKPHHEPDYQEPSRSRVARLVDILLIRRVPDHQRIAWTLAAMFPAAYFVTANVLNFIFGVPWLYAPMDALLRLPLADVLFEALAPVVFLGGLAWALAANLAAMLDLQLALDKGTLRGTVVFKPRWASGLVFGAAGLSLGILLLYLAAENLSPA